MGKVWPAAQDILPSRATTFFFRLTGEEGEEKKEEEEEDEEGEGEEEVEALIEPE